MGIETMAREAIKSTFNQVCEECYAVGPEDCKIAKIAKKLDPNFYFSGDTLCKFNMDLVINNLMEEIKKIQERRE